TSPGRGCASPSLAHVIDQTHLEAMTLTLGPQRVDVPAAPHAVPEVAADEYQACAECPDEHARHELLRSLLTQALIEREHEGGVDTRVLEQFELLLVAHKRLWAALGAKEREGVAVERHDRRHEVLGIRHLLERVDDRAVPHVHTVELADRD